ncbi:hypothetical protein J1614_008090 [Plenodomus biglobosus]|nr:hypothetical protein J1614_008090 [Plenodomus biglobosus]
MRATVGCWMEKLNGSDGHTQRLLMEPTIRFAQHIQRRSFERPWHGETLFRETGSLAASGLVPVVIFTWTHPAIGQTLDAALRGTLQR